MSYRQWVTEPPGPPRPKTVLRIGEDYIEITPYSFETPNMMAHALLAGIQVTCSVPGPLESAKLAAVPALRQRLEAALDALTQFEIN